MSIQAVGAVIGSGLLTGVQYTICLAIANHADADGFAYPSLTLLAYEARCDRSTVKRNMLSMIRAGYFTKVGAAVSPVGTNLYRLNVEKFEQAAKETASLRRKFNDIPNVVGVGAQRARRDPRPPLGALDAPRVGAPDAPRVGAPGAPLIINNHHIILREPIDSNSRCPPSAVDMDKWKRWRIAAKGGPASELATIRAIRIDRDTNVVCVPRDRDLSELARSHANILSDMGVVALQSDETRRWVGLASVGEESSKQKAVG